MRTSQNRLNDILDYLVDDLVGIVHSVEGAQNAAGVPNFFHFWALASNTQAFSRQANFARAGGASIDWETARSKAIGEAVERYCAAIYYPEELPISSYENAPFPCIAPTEFALYSKEQYALPRFPYVPFEGVTPVRWTCANDLLTREKLHVPAAMVYVPYEFHPKIGDNPIVQPISTGLACHCSFAEAATNAICEVIERDALMITWQAQLARQHILTETLTPHNAESIKRFEKAGYSISLLNITTDVGVPSVLAVSRNNSVEAPPLVVAGSVAMNPEEAVRKSLEELDHTRDYYQWLKLNRARLTPDPEYNNVVDQASHINFWCDPANTPLANFLFSSEEYVSFDEIENISMNDAKVDLQVLLNKVRAAKYRVLLCDLTSPDVRELGLVVVRAIIPGFQPMFIGHKQRSLGGRRLSMVPMKLGYQSILAEGKDNPAPHPYP